MVAYDNTIEVERNFGKEDPNKVLGEFAAQKIKIINEKQNESKKTNICELPYVSE